jgi:hypothetical protein
MNTGNIVKWGVIAVLVFVAWRFLSGLGNQAVSGLQQTWNPGYTQPVYGGGVIYLSPGLARGNYRPGRRSGNWKR